MIHKLPSVRPTKLCLNSNRPYLSNYWTVNDRLRIKNEKLSKRQHSSCRIAFCSLWICILTSVMCIVIYRFRDECAFVTNGKEFFLKCFTYWCFFVAFGINLLACSGVIYGICRYFYSQPHRFLCNNKYQLHFRNNKDLITVLCSNETSITPTRQTESTNVVDSLTNISSRRNLPPFNYEELPTDSNPILISKSVNNHNNKNIFLLSSTSSLPQSNFSTAIPHNDNRSTCLTTTDSPTERISETDVWKKQ